MREQGERDWMDPRRPAQDVPRQVTLRLTPATNMALQAEAKRRGVTYSALAEELIVAGLADQTAARLEDRALPTFIAAVEGVLLKHARRQERRDAARLAPVARNAGMAARVAYAHLYRDYPDQAEGDWQEAGVEIEAALTERELPLVGGEIRAGVE